MIGPTFQRGKFRIQITELEPFVIVKIRNSFNFCIQWVGRSVPSDKVIDEMTDIHQRTFAGKAGIN